MNDVLRNDIERLTASINQYVTRFGLTAKIGLDFGYYWQSDEIEYCLVVTEKFDRLWTEYLKTNYSDVTAPLFIWSLFHEIGHARTDELMSINAHIRIDNYKKTLNPDNEEDIKKYYRCQDEALATYWAYWYIKKHAQEVEALWNEWQPLIEKIYVNQGVDI